MDFKYEIKECIFFFFKKKHSERPEGLQESKNK